MDDVELGDSVSFELREGSTDKLSILVIGYVTNLAEDGRVAEVAEAHAFHPIWGGSNGGRGKLHPIVVTQLKPCPPTYEHIVDQVKSKHEWR